MCGVFGVYGHKQAPRLTYLGLYALQHRGEEAAGIVSFDGKRTFSYKDRGLVGDIFNERTLATLKGFLAVGHTRYSTTGSSSLKNVQPFLANYSKVPLAVSHNGNFTNTFLLRKQLEEEGAIFQTTMDSELVIHLLAKSSEKDYFRKVIDALSKIEGAYSLVLMIGDRLVGARDPLGFRPLCLGKLEGAYLLSSETCALDLVGATYLRDVAPGEVVFIDKDGIKSLYVESKRRAFCIFEYIYFARPDSNIFGDNVYMVRKKLGEALAREANLEAELVMPIPDSGNYAALGFSQASGIKYEMAVIRNHYVGRTFIQPSQFIRDFRVRVKLNPIRELLKDKRVVIIEDSIVRGTTSRVRVKTLREAGAKEVHMRVSCPPIKHPCFYGIDFPTRKELIASSKSVEEIREFMGLDSLYYLSKEGMLSSMPIDRENFCTACFDGCYPTRLHRNISKYVLEKS